MKKLDLSQAVQAKRYPTKNGRYYGPKARDIYNTTPNPLKPSWTNIASIENSPGLSEWKMRNGRWAEIDGPTAAIKGTIAHWADDKMNFGQTVTREQVEEKVANYPDIRWKLIYSSIYPMVDDIMKMIWSYKLWYDEHQPVILASEIMMWHKDVPYAGTADMVCKFFSKKQNQDIIMLIDIKTGQENEAHSVQCMAYSILFEKIYNVKVGAIGSLYTTGKWRGEEKPGKMKVKMIRNKAGEFTNDAHYLMNRVTTIYEHWLGLQKKAQPDMKRKIPTEFSLNIKKDTK
tara:strand:- start:9435 stop:10298 length:864 start_codon:yes stop_codon:yes gene_type:complete